METDVPFRPLQATATHMMHRHVCRSNTHTRKEKELRLCSFAIFDVKRMGARSGIYLSWYHVWTPAFHKGGMVRHTYNPSTEKVEVGSPDVTEYSEPGENVLGFKKYHLRIPLPGLLG